MPRPARSSTLPDKDARYTGVAIALHWSIALIVIANLAGGLAMDSAGPELRRTIIGAHTALGLTVIALTLVRIGWRLGHRPPPLPAHMTPMERWLAKATHFGFYGLMLALPLTGWALVSTGRVTRPVSMFGMFSVPALPLQQSLRGVFHQSHGLLGWVMLAMVVLHGLAAVKHRIFDRDDLLARMLPRRRN